MKGIGGVNSARAISPGLVRPNLGEFDLEKDKVNFR